GFSEYRDYQSIALRLGLFRGDCPFPWRTCRSGQSASDYSYACADFSLCVLAQRQKGHALYVRLEDCEIERRRRCENPSHVINPAIACFDDSIHPVIDCVRSSNKSAVVRNEKAGFAAQQLT